MSSMSESDIQKFHREWNWGTLIAIEGDRPYAIELAPMPPMAHISIVVPCPADAMARCIRDDSNVVFKICDSTNDGSRFRTAMVEGKVKRLTQKAEIVQGLRVLYKKLGFPDIAH